MKERKLKLEDFKVQSFVTSTSGALQGGGGVKPDLPYTTPCSANMCSNACTELDTCKATNWSCTITDTCYTVCC